MPRPKISVVGRLELSKLGLRYSVPDSESRKRKTLWLDALAFDRYLDYSWRGEHLEARWGPNEELSRRLDREDPKAAEEFLESQRREPQMLPTKYHWAYRGKVFQVESTAEHTDEDTPLFIKHYVLRQESEYEKVRREVEALENMERLDRTAREPIPESVRLFVWQRDRGQCVKCGSREKLEFDHIIPLSSGGSSTERNIQLLCESCNRSKGPTI